MIERDLLNLKKKFEKEKNMTKTERQIRNSLRPYTRFLDIEEFEELVKALHQEIKYKEMIDNLTALNLNGNNCVKDIEDIIMNDEFM